MATPVNHSELPTVVVRHANTPPPDVLQAARAAVLRRIRHPAGPARYPDSLDTALPRMTP